MSSTRSSTTRDIELPLYIRIRQILLDARKHVVRAVNTAMVHTYFEIGRAIVEDEQKGESRAEYGRRTLAALSVRLSEEFGRGFSRQNLQNMKQFYLCFRNCQTLSGKLSWSHYLLLMRLDDKQARGFYLKDAESENWSVRELERQINSMLFERLSLSRDKDEVRLLSEKGQIIESPEDIIKDPYVLEFLGLPEKAAYTENELETALIDRLQDFLLELGKGFTFVARQKRITLDGEHFYIDLVFYNRLLRCFVLVDLKIGKLTHQDLGQIQMYVHYYDRVMKTDEESPTIGIVLCRDKKETVVRYTLPEDNRQIFASKYQLYLPTEEELVRRMEQLVPRLEAE
ncbi:MAG: DUF1016 family protein [Thermoplasmata archaeon]|nr:DUF1016 family protein [Thermoplasmata archaeon]